MKNLLGYSLLLILLLYVIFKPGSDYIPSQEDIQSDSYVDQTKSVKDFPYPQLSRSFKKLSEGEIPSPILHDKSLPSGDTTLDIIRTSTSDKLKQRMYLPDYYRKDRLSGNPDSTEELRPFSMNKDKSENSWTDVNVSEHPKFYNAEIKDELTNIGSFFDENNNYADQSSPNSESLPSDSCYEDKMGNTFCKDNTRLQLIPPSLISDPNNSYALSTIGPYKNNTKRNESTVSVINGGVFYDNIKASLKTNEFFSSFDNKPIEVVLNY